MVCRISLNEAHPGDVLNFKGSGFLFEILSRVIKIKVPTWDRWGWHLAPIVAPGIIMDAQWPRLTLTDYTQTPSENIRAYRISEEPPTQQQLDDYIQYTLGCHYDFIVYFLTAFAILLRPQVDFPRVINRRYTCWEATWELIGFIKAIITHNYNYPFLTDLIHWAGEC